MYIKEIIWEINHKEDTLNLIDEIDWYEVGFAGKDFDTVDELLAHLIKEYGDNYTTLTDEEDRFVGFQFHRNELFDAELGTYVAIQTLVDIYISMTKPIIETIETNITLPVFNH